MIERPVRKSVNFFSQYAVKFVQGAILIFLVMWTMGLPYWMPFMLPAKATAPTLVINSAVQKTNGTGSVDISVTVNDADLDDTLKLRVGYKSGSDCSSPVGLSLATIDTTDANTTATYGDPKVDNTANYRVGSAAGWITTSSGANTVQFDWLSATDIATGDGTFCLRMMSNDGVTDSTYQETSLTIDNVAPTGMGSFSVAVVATTTDTPSWTVATETNFNHYEIWYGTSQTDVQGRTGTANEWDNADDVNMATRTTTTTTITGLSINKLYYYKIWAIDNYGGTQTLDDANLYTLADTPGTPTVSAASTSTLTVAISADNNPAITEYAIYENGTGKYVQSGGTLDTTAAWQTAAAWGTKTVTGLTNNTQYVVKVKARNGNTTETSFGSTTSKYTYASQVSSFTATEATDKSNYKITLTWTNPTPTPSGFAIYQDTSCDDTWDTTVYSNASSMPSSPYSISGLSANACYKFRSATYNGDGMPNLISRPETTAETLGPGQPTGLTHTANTTSSITWDWADVSGATDYKVYRSSDDTLLATVGSATSAYTLSTLSANTQYTVYIRATNASGEGIGSSTASAYTSANIPVSLDHANQTTTAMRWTWVSGGAESGFWARSTNPTDAIADWTTNLYWDQSGLTANNPVVAYVKAKNGNGDETSEGSITKYTSMNDPSGVTYSSISATSITVTATGTFPNLTSGSSAIYFSNGTTSLWQQSAEWVNSDLLPNTNYTYSYSCRNGDGDAGALSLDNVGKYTLANVPSAPTVQSPAATTLAVIINQNSNPSNTTYAIQEVNGSKYVQANGSLGDSAAWQTYTVWGGTSGVTVTGLSVNTSYQFKVKAKNGDGTETALSGAASLYTAQNTPTAVTASATDSTFLTVTATGTFTNLTTLSSGLYFENITNSTNSGWVQTNSWNNTGLSGDTTYQYRAKARNADGTATSFSSAFLLTTNSGGRIPDPGPAPAPAPPPAPKQCADNNDNDSDGLIDLADPGCADANDNNEADHPQAPTVSEPANGSATNNNKPYVIGATWQGTQSIDIYIDNVKVNSLTSQADKNYIWKVATELPDGLHEVYALVSALKSNVNSFLVDTQPPNAPLIDLVSVVKQEKAGEDISASVKIQGQAYAGTKYLLLYLDNNILLSTIAITGNTWSYDLAGVLSSGTHTVFAKATDAVNNVSPVATKKGFTLALAPQEPPKEPEKPLEPEKTKEPEKPLPLEEPKLPEQPEAPKAPEQPEAPKAPEQPVQPPPKPAGPETPTPLPVAGGEQPLNQLGGGPGAPEGGEAPLPSGGILDQLNAGDKNVIQHILDSGEMAGDLIGNPVMNNLVMRIDQKNEWDKSADERQLEMIYETQQILDSKLVQKTGDLAAKVISQITGQNIEKVTVQVKQTVTVAVKTAKKVEKATVDNPTVEKVNTYAKQPIIATTVATSTAAVATVGTTGVTGASALTYLQFLFTQPLLLFARRKREKWGVVYNSVTKRPVDLAVVRVFDAVSGRLLRTRVTDREGRYFFLLNPGKYRVVVEKKEFKFPSSILGDQKQDGKFENIYNGGEFAVTEKDALNRPIPLDPQRALLPAKQVLRLSFVRNWQRSFTFVGPALALLSLIINPKWWVGGIFVAQVVIYFIFKKLALGEKPKSFGLVKHMETKKTISRAVVRVFDTKFNKLLESQVSDTGGRYGFLVGNQEYYMTAEKPGFFEERTGRYDLSNEPHGYLADDFHLRPHGLGDDIVSAQRQGRPVTWRSDFGRQIEQDVDGVRKVVRKDEEKFNEKVAGVNPLETHEDYYKLDYLGKRETSETNKISEISKPVNQ